MNQLVSTSGDDVLEGTSGNDTIDGGDGIDTLIINAALGNVTVNLINSTTSSTLNTGNDTVSNIERYNIIAGYIDFTGDAQDNFILANASTAILRGGLGNDTYIIQNADAQIFESAMAGIDQVIARSSYTLSENVENASFALGVNGAFDLTGNGSANELRGSNGDNLLIGGSNNDLLIGGHGNDTLDGGFGSDRLDGGSGNDIYIIDSADDIILFDQSGNDTVITSSNYILSSNLAIETMRIALGATIDVTGNAFNQNIIGSSASNRLNGMGGDDVLEGGFGSDVIDGGIGDDAADYREAIGSIFADLGGNGDLGGYVLETNDIGPYGPSSVVSSSDNLIAIENIIGSRYGDRLYGDARANILAGGQGSDIIYGGAGHDTLSFFYNNGAIFLDLNTGSAQETTTVEGTVLATDNTISIDLFYQFENVIGSNFGDRIYGDIGDNILSGFGGNDILYGSLGNDTISFAKNLGAIYVDSSANFALETNQTNRTISNNDIIISTDYFYEFENIVGSQYGDRIYGDATDNRISGLAGSDIIYGGDGVDTLSYANNIGAVSIDLTNAIGLETEQNVFNTAFVINTDIILEFENVIGSIFSDRIQGSEVNNIIIGGAGSDILSGGGGADILSYEANSGAVYVYVSGTANETATTSGLVSASDPILSTDSFNGFETIIGSAFGDRIYGDADDSVLSGFAGSDILYGGGGDDTISFARNTGAVSVNLAGYIAYESNQSVYAYSAAVSTDYIFEFDNIEGSAFDDQLSGDAAANRINGGDGNDILIGGAGSDILSGGGGADILSYEANSGAVYVYVSGTANETATTSGLVSASDPILSTDSFNGFETIIGSAFGDRIYGDADDSVLSGFAGSDILYGGGGDDTISFARNTGAVSVNLAGYIAYESNQSVYAYSAAVSTDYIFEFDNIEGSAFDDQLSGDAAANRINGGDGNDILIGGAGADTFYFDALGADQITDFVSMSDKIYLSRAHFGLAAGTNPVVVVNGAATQPNSFIYDSNAGTLSFDADGAGTNPATLILTLGAGQTINPTLDLVVYG
jgi:Ca2+-binding RTX toxin-like protein